MRISELFQPDRSWRWFESIDPGQGGGGDNSVDPSTDPGGGAGIGLPADTSIGPVIPPPSYPTGPPSQSSYYHGSPSNAPPSPPDPWGGISSSVHSQAAQDVDKFEQLIGGAAQGFDSEGTALKLAKSGANITGGSFDAFQWLYDNTLTDAQRQNSPWAQYGLDKDSYTTTVAKMDSAYFSWTGDQLSAQGTAKNSMLWQSIRASATPDQIENLAIYGNLTGTGPVLAQAQYTGDMPWLSAGQTYSSTLQSFQSFENQTPTDKSTLAAFWRFGQSAKQLGGSALAVGSAAKQLQGSTSEVR